MEKKTLNIVKVGGNVINDSIQLDEFLKSFAMIKGPKILVHGGGKLATKLANDLNIPVQIVEGRRITNAENLSIITMVYAGEINKNIVAKLQNLDCNALGFSGADGNTIVANKREDTKIDFGFVGDIKKVNTQLIEVLLNQNIVPCFCAITHDKKGQLLNTNADTIASELAIALSKLFNVNLFYCFEKGGVLSNTENEKSIIEKLNYQAYFNFKSNGVIKDGMIPKLDNCFHALQNGVASIHIGNLKMISSSSNKHTILTYDY